MKNFAAESGQGLLEMVVAIGIITSGIASTVALVSASLGASTEGKLRFVGTNIAREGVEVIRMIRDTNWLEGQTWNTGLTNGVNDRTAIAIMRIGSRDFVLNFLADDLTHDRTIIYRWITGSNKDIHIQRNTPPAGGNPTIFRRLIAMQPICRDSSGVETVIEGDTAVCPGGTTEVGVDIRSTVQWTVKNKIQNVMVEEKIYDWR